MLSVAIHLPVLRAVSRFYVNFITELLVNGRNDLNLAMTVFIKINSGANTKYVFSIFLFYF